MLITVIKEDQTVYVNGEALKPDLDWQAVQFDIAQWLGESGWTVTNHQETPLESANILAPFVTAWQAKKSEMEQAQEAVPTPVPTVITPRQLILQLVADGLITQQEGVAWATNRTLPAAIDAALAALPGAEETTARITIASMIDVDRSNPLVWQLAQALDPEAGEELLDAFFIAAAAL